jgi:hypothetical protein
MEWTIEYIAARNRARGRKFFSENNLRFFGQGLSDFEVFEAAGRVFVYCGVHRGWDTGAHLSTFGEYDKQTSRIKGIAHPKGAYENWRRDEVMHLMDVIREDADATRREKDALPIK